MTSIRVEETSRMVQVSVSADLSPLLPSLLVDGARVTVTAYRHLAWWANEHDGQHVNAPAWLDAGWKVDSFNQSGKWVRFRRGR